MGRMIRVKNFKKEALASYSHYPKKAFSRLRGRPGIEKEASNALAHPFQVIKLIK
jgi:hypothetical protein